MNAPFSHMTPDAPQAIVFTPAMRRLIADAIESLILLLDEIDGDAELEDDDPAEENGDLEPSLGAFELVNQETAWRTIDSGHGGQDLELDNADREPSLGAPENHPTPYSYTYGGEGNQTHWAAGGFQDIESDPAEAGIGDVDGLMEQWPSDWYGRAE